MKPISLLVGALLAATVAASIWLAPGRTPAPGRETTLWLAVESLAVDGDLVDHGDRQRFHERFGVEPEAVYRRADSEDREFDAPWLWSRLAAAARRLGPAGPYLLQSLLFVLTAALGWVTLKGRLGVESGALQVGVALFGSALFLVPFRFEPHALDLLAGAVAGASLWYRRHRPSKEPETIYGGELDTRPSPLRWLVSGLAFGVVLAGSVAYLPLAWPLLAAGPKGRRGATGSLFVAGLALSLGAIVVGGGAPWEPIEALFDGHLLFWDAIGLAIGRDVGILPTLLPVVLLLASCGGDEGRRWLPLACVAACLVQLVVAPFDFVEGVVAPGNAWLFAPFALLLMAGERAEARGWMLAPLIAAAPFLGTSWLGPVGPDTASKALGAWTARVSDLLPVASTLRSAPGAIDLARPELLVRGLEPGFRPAAGGKLRWAERRATLLVVSTRPLASVRLELGGDAPSELEVRGGTLGDLTFRPNGDVAVDVAFAKRSARTHPVWWSPETASIYQLELVLPKPPTGQVTLDAAFARGVVPEASKP